MSPADLSSALQRLNRLTDETIALVKEARVYLSERREREKSQHDALPGFVYRPDRVGEFGP